MNIGWAYREIRPKAPLTKSPTSRKEREKWGTRQGRSVLGEAIAGSGRVGDPHYGLESLQREMYDADKADDAERILDRFGRVQEEYEHLDG